MMASAITMRRPRGIWIIGLGILALVGPWMASPYILHILVIALIWIIVVSAWDLVMGYGGIFNFAQLALFAIGGYASSMLSMHAGLPTAFAPFLAAAITAAAGFLIALPCLRLRGEYVALFTFAVHLALPTFFEKGRAFGTGGASGLVGVPPIEVMGFSFATSDKLAWFYLALGAAGLAVWFIYGVILPGRLGQAIIALRDSEPHARALGINDYSVKIQLFVVSAAITGFGGALYAHYIAVMTPRVLGNEFFLMVMIMLSIGGMGRFPGAIIGAVLVTVGNEAFRGAGEYRLLILGILVVVVVLWLPNGLVSMGWNLRPKRSVS